MKSEWFSRPSTGNIQRTTADFNLDEIKKALNKAVNPNVLIDEKKYTPLQLTLRGDDHKDKMNVMKLLIEGKADVNLTGINMVNNYNASSSLLKMATISEHNRLAFVQVIMAAKSHVYWHSQLPFIASILSEFLNYLVSHTCNGSFPLIPISGFEQVREKLFVVAELFKTDKDKILELSINTFDRFVEGFEKFPPNYLSYDYTYLAFFGYLFLNGIKSMAIDFLSFPKEINNLILFYLYTNAQTPEQITEKLFKFLKINAQGLRHNPHNHELMPRPYEGSTPIFDLSKAVFKLDYPLVKTLIEAKADVTSEDNDSSYTPLDFSIETNTVESKELSGARLKTVIIITKALRTSYINWLVRSNKIETPTSMQSKWIKFPQSHTVEITVALDSKVDLNNFIDDKVTTPLMLAFNSVPPNLELMKLLLTAGADPNFLKKNKNISTSHPTARPPAENLLTLVLYNVNYDFRLETITLLLDYGAKVFWKSEKGLMTALTPFSHAMGRHRYQMKTLKILAELLKKGAGLLPMLFNEYNQFSCGKTGQDSYRRYAHLALLGYFFLSKIQQMRLAPTSSILNNFFPALLSQIIYGYYANDPIEYFNTATERLLECVETNRFLGENYYRPNLKLKPWPYPNYPLSLAAYTDFSKMQRLIEAKADVAFIDPHSERSPLDYVVKQNPAVEKDHAGDWDSNKPNNRFERVKIVTDALKDCYQQTLLGEAQRVTELLKANSFSTSSQLSTSPS